MTNVGIIGVYLENITNNHLWSAGIFTLRTFAIYHRNWVVLAILATMGVSRIALELVSI